MKVDPHAFRPKPGRRIRLKAWLTAIKPLYKSDAQYEKRLAEGIERLSAEHQRFAAAHRPALLLIFQGMDTAGKDGVIRHVMSGINPQGCSVFSFKQPSAEELDHDFLWRTTCRLPTRGRIGIFNRSYYEEVVVVRVHPELLRAQRLPAQTLRGKDFWTGRYRSIVELERHLHRSGTQILKFFLHLSHEEQRLRLLARIDDPGKNWKFSAADVAERARWKDYTRAYEDCLSATAKAHAPWFIVPADDKRNARLIVAGIVRHALEDLKLAPPRLDRAQRKELRSIRARLAKQR